MMKLPVFLFVLVGSVVGVSVGALAWPKFMTKPRPPILQDVNDVVRNTQVGKNIVRVLGVEDEAGIEPININSVAQTLTSTATTIVQEKTREIITTQVVNQLVKQYETLPAKDQEQIQQTICKP